MSLPTKESSWASSLIPTNWSTTLPPLMAMTVGTADTWRAEESFFTDVESPHLLVITSYCDSETGVQRLKRLTFNQHKNDSSFSHPIFDGQVSVVVNVHLCHGDTAPLLCDGLLQSGSQNFTRTTPPSAFEHGVVIRVYSIFRLLIHS